MSGLLTCRSLWPTFAGRLAEDFDAFKTRLIACFELEELQRSEPLTDKAKVGMLLLLLPPASAAAHYLQQAPRTPQTLQQALDHLRNRFSSQTSQDLTKAALHNALHLRRFRDAEHASELVESALDDIDRLGLALKLPDAAMRESLLRYASTTRQFFRLAAYLYDRWPCSLADVFATSRACLSCSFSLQEMRLTWRHVQSMQQAFGREQLLCRGTS